MEERQVQNSGESESSNTLETEEEIRLSQEDLTLLENVMLETEAMEAESGRGRVGEALQHLHAGNFAPHWNLSSSLIEQKRHKAVEAQLRFSSTIICLQEERDKAIQKFQDEAQRRAKQNKFSDTLLRPRNLSSDTSFFTEPRDLDEMGKALDHSRQAAKQAKRQQARLEAEVEHLMSEKRALAKLIIEAGPWALWDWVKKEIVQQGLQPGEDFEQRWLAWLAVTEDVGSCSSASSMPADSHAPVKVPKDDGAGQSLIVQNLQDRATGLYGGGEKSSFLMIVFSIIKQEGTINLHYVLDNGLLFLPMAWFSFWLCLSGRITWHVAQSILSSFLGFISLDAAIQLLCFP